MKVVLDTNVLIDGFRDEYSYQKRIINEIAAGRMEAAANRQTLRENRLILNRLITDTSYRTEMENFFAQIEEVENHRNVRIVSDPEDNKILESAVESKSDYLITEDHALLEIGQYEGVKIVVPGQFWAIYSEVIDGDPWQKWIRTYIDKE
jgi:putative PIN family toxin of toxin-antitoxin system